MHPVKAVLLLVGDELLSGARADSHAAPLARFLADHGVAVARTEITPDRRESITHAMRAAAASSDLVIVTGGLGPTDDDVTREALGDLLAPGEPLKVDGDAFCRIERRFADRGEPMPASNARQAQCPVGATTVLNPHGTAPGLVAKCGNATIVCLPGPALELWEMVPTCIPPIVSMNHGQFQAVAIHAVGIGESAAAERLGDLLERGRDPTVGITVCEGIVSARIRSMGTRALDRVDAAARAVRAAWGPYVFGEGDQTLAGAIGRALRTRGQSLSTAESCTGGLIGAACTAGAGASRWYRGGVVAYENQVKSGLLGVASSELDRYGAVSREVAGGMARGALEACGSTWAVSTTGIAGPEGGSDSKPVGTVFVGVAERTRDGRMHSSARHFRLSGGRDMIRQRAVSIALASIWWSITERPTTSLLWEVRE